jgi:hypothetical protein
MMVTSLITFCKKYLQLSGERKIMLSNPLIISSLLCDCEEFRTDVLCHPIARNKKINKNKEKAKVKQIWRN